MSVLLQISDPHFGTEQAPVVEALARLAAQERPGVLVLSGDITQRARPRQFEAARAFVERLAIPLRLVLPGNHDIPLFDLPARVFRPYANYQRAFGMDLEPLLDLPDLLAIGVNTTRAHRHTDGEISAAQVQRVCERLRSARPEQLRLVVTHQPVHVTRRQDEHDRVHGSAAAVRAWSGAGADLVMGGHIHLPYVRSLQERFSDLPRRLWCVQAGTAVSSRVRREAPNSVCLLRYGDATPAGHCAVERWNYLGATAGFVRAETQMLAPDRGAPSPPGPDRTRGPESGA